MLSWEKLTDWRRCCWRLLDKYIATVIIFEKISRLVVEPFRNHRPVSRNAVTFHRSTVSFTFKVLFFNLVQTCQSGNYSLPSQRRKSDSTFLDLLVWIHVVLDVFAINMSESIKVRRCSGEFFSNQTELTQFLESLIPCNITSSSLIRLPNHLLGHYSQCYFIHRHLNNA